MLIKTEQVRKGYWRADFTELPGSPECGEGKTRLEAVACLFIRQRDKLEFLQNSNHVLTIDGKQWTPGVRKRR